MHILTNLRSAYPMVVVVRENELHSGHCVSTTAGATTR